MASHSIAKTTVLTVDPASGVDSSSAPTSDREDHMNPLADAGDAQPALRRHAKSSSLSPLSIYLSGSSHQRVKTAQPAPTTAAARTHKPNCWLRCCNSIERCTQAVLGEVAAFAARRSCIVIALCMSFVLLCGAGSAFFTVLWRSAALCCCVSQL